MTMTQGSIAHYRLGSSVFGTQNVITKGVIFGDGGERGGGRGILTLWGEGERGGRHTEIREGIP